MGNNLEQLFINYLVVEKRYSVHTTTAYKQDLSQLYSFIQQTELLNIFEPDSVEQIDHRMLRNWMGDLLAEGCSHRTVARKISTVKAYFSWLMKGGKISKNPAKRVKVPSYEKKLPAFLKESETEFLLDQLDFPQNFEGVRDKCMLEMLYGCGLRRSELINLCFEDIDSYNQQLRIKGKGRKERLVPFGKHVSVAIDCYMLELSKLGISQSGHFFRRKNGQKLYPKLVYRLVQKYLAQASSISRKSPHVLRHTYATHLLDNGADLNAIKELLGHSSLASTQVYTHNTISKLKAVHKQAHPRADNHKD